MIRILFLIVGLVFTPLRGADLQPLLFEGEDVPGMPGVPITFLAGDTLGPSGHVLVSMNFRNPDDGSTDGTVMLISPDGSSVEPLIKSGDSVSGASGTAVNPKGYAITASGEVLLKVGFDVAGNNRETWAAGTPGNLVSIFQRGQPLPDFAPGAVASDFIFDEFAMGMNRHGEIAFLTKVLNGGSPIGFGIWKGTSAGMVLEIRTGNFYPGMPPGATLTSISDAWINDDGVVAFLGSIRIGSINKGGIWTYESGAVTPILLSGDAAVASDMPSGQTWSGPIEIHSFASNGWIAFSSAASGNEGGLFVAQGANISRVTRDHFSVAGVAPGTGGAKFDIRATSPGFTATFFKVASTGRAVIAANLVSGTGSPATNNSTDRGIWIWDGGGLSLLFREGDPAPGYTGGTTLIGIGSARFSQEGRLHFDSTALNSSATSIWSENDSGGFGVTADRNMTVDNPGNGVSQSNSTSFAVNPTFVGPGNSTDGGPSSVNALGQVLVRGSTVNLSPNRNFIAIANAGQLTIPGSISGRVRFDIDGDGDPADNDNGIPDLTVELFLDNGLGVSDGPAIAETTTASDGSGSFSFPSVNPGNYLIQVSSSVAMQTANHLWTLPEGLPAGVIALVTVEPGLAAPPVEILSTNPVEVNGIVKEDTNGDNLGDLPLSGVQVELVRVEDEQVVALVVTGQNGTFHFPLVRPGLYALRETDLPNFISIEDSEGAPTDNLVFISLTSGVTFPPQEFVDRNDSNFLVSLRGLDSNPDTRTVTQNSFALGADDPGLPLILRSNYNLLDLTPVIAKGLIADGVTPLLIGLKSQTPLGEDRTLEWRVEVTGGDIAGGIYPKMQVWESGTFWRPAVVPTPETPNTITLTQGPADRSVFLQIRALQPWDLVFAGTTELRLDLSFFEIGNTVPVTSRTILIRRPPIGIIPDLGAGEIGSGFLGQLEHGRPPEFIIVLDSAQVGHQSFDRFRFDWSFVQGDIIGHGRGGILALQAHGQGQINFNRGEFRRMVGIGVPHNGSLLHTYLGPMEGRLRSLDFGNPALRYLPASISQVALWDDLRSQGDDAHALLTLDPLSPFFQEKPFGSVPRSQTSLTGFNPITVHHIATRIDPEQSPALRQIGLGHLTAYPSAATGLHKFVATSDGLIDLASQSAGIRDSGEDDFLTPRPYNTRLSEIITDHPAHGEPAILFGGATTQLQSGEVARRSLEWLDTPLSNKADGIYRAPSPVSASVIDTIAFMVSQRTFNDIIEIFSLPPPSGFKVGPLNQGAAPLGVTEYRYEIQPPVEAPATGSINWFAEIHGPDGPTTLGVSVEPDADDPLKVTVSVAEGLVGDVVVYVSYETTNDQIVYGRPGIVVSLPPDGETLTGIDLQPETLNLAVGRTIQPDIMAVYSQGTRIRRVVTPSDLGAISSSAPAILDVSDPLNWRALAEGTATVTLTALGFTDIATITVIDPFPRQTLTEWKADRYSPEDLLNPLISGNDVDRDGDGLDVLLEYLTGGDDRETDFDFLPKLRITEPSEPDPGRLVYTVRVSNTLEAVTNFEVRSSLNLTQWAIWFDLLTDPFDLANPRVINYRNFGTFTEVDFALPASGDPEFLHLEGDL